MKTKIIILLILASLFESQLFAQDRTTVNAMNYEISDNLDLRAVASIFGDSENLEDFERRLNDPRLQISNLDLNQDNKVDYLRVIESVEGNAHLIVIQSVLGRDLFQDIATVEVERDIHNEVQVQVVGDVYMYGNNCIYEPVYVHTPVIFNCFWGYNYRPYCSTWYWNYYPTYYYTWCPIPIYSYRSHVGISINFNHQYNYVNYRRCGVAYNTYKGNRCNAYETRYSSHRYASKNTNYSSRTRTNNYKNYQSTQSRKSVAQNSNRNYYSTRKSNGNSSAKQYSTKKQTADLNRGNKNQRITSKSSSPNGKTRSNVSPRELSQNRSNSRSNRQVSSNYKRS